MGCDNYHKLPKSTENYQKLNYQKLTLTQTITLTLNPKPLTLTRRCDSLRLLATIIQTQIQTLNCIKLVRIKVCVWVSFR